MRLAWPVLAEEILNLLVGFTEWWLAGHFFEGTQYKAAMTLAMYALWVTPSLFSAVAIGTTALTARFIGAGEPDRARHVLHQSLLVGGLLSVLVTAGVLAWSEDFVAAMNYRDDAAARAIEYLAILAVVVPAIMFEQVVIAGLRGAGDTVSGLVAKVGVNVVNAIVSAGCVVGWGLFPQIGWRGLALGAASGHVVGALILLVILLRGRAGLRLRLSDFRPDRDLIRRLLRVGLPGGFDVLAVVACHLAYLAIISRLGPLAAGGHGLGVQLESLVYSAGAAFYVAAATLTGQFLGAGDPQRAAQAVRTTGLIAIVYYSVAGLGLFFGGHLLTGFFTGPEDAGTAMLAADYLRIVSFSLPSLAIVMVLTGALRGAGDTRWPVMMTFVGLVFVRVCGACFLAWPEVPLFATGIVLPGLDLNVYGAWYAMVADVVLRSVLFVARFAQGGWKRVKV